MVGEMGGMVEEIGGTVEEMGGMVSKIGETVGERNRNGGKEKGETLGDRNGIVGARWEKRWGRDGRNGGREMEMKGNKKKSGEQQSSTDFAVAHSFL